ncbi:hypothetical protein O6P43_029724 [Quillaja saponaria]|uniref:Uncharacterized protein n=1 Tax=Quillaja saponaria TaxID=32244 RepID=A0AAD7L0S9_QUISA|nr:hypothetical protein O6P43_029724 [Quillaja saponaria]
MDASFTKTSPPIYRYQIFQFQSDFPQNQQDKPDFFSIHISYTHSLQYMNNTTCYSPITSMLVNEEPFLVPCQKLLTSEAAGKSFLFDKLSNMAVRFSKDFLDSLITDLVSLVKETDLNVQDGFAERRRIFYMIVNVFGTTHYCFDNDDEIIDDQINYEVCH